MCKETERINRAFSRAVKSYDQEAFVQKKIARRLAKMLPVGMACHSLFEFGCGTGLLTEALHEQLRVEQWFLNDLSASMLQETIRCVPLEQYRLLEGDAGEQFSELPPTVDIIASSSALQWIEDPFSFLERILERLSPKGMLLIATFGKRNLHELRQHTGRGLHYYDSEEYRDFLKNKFHQVEVVEEQMTITFPSLLSLLHHLRATGVTHLPHQENVSYLCCRGSLLHLEERYRRAYPLPSGELPLTYHTIYIKCSDKV